MNIPFNQQKNTLPHRILCGLIAFSFVFTMILPPQVAAQVMPASVLNLPIPGSMVTMSSGFIPPLVKGITVHPENPLMFDFIVDSGESLLEGDELKREADKMIKYFLASLTVPEDEMWVNLSPYEKDRIIPDSFGLTMMGRDLLAQDYLLKQLTASLMYPEDELGSRFWNRVYTKAQEMYGTTEIPMNTFNKIWIIPETAVVFEKDNSAYVVESHLKVMLEKDYVAMREHMKDEGRKTKDVTSNIPRLTSHVESEIQTDIIREILIPEIEREVNQGETFANLRQIYNSMILATWFKSNLKESLLGQVYVDKNKTKGVDVEDRQVKQKIYDQYLEAFSKGVYNYIKEDIDPVTNQMIPRKYFSGGFTANKIAQAITEVYDLDAVHRRALEPSGSTLIYKTLLVENAGDSDQDDGQGIQVRDEDIRKIVGGDAVDWEIASSPVNSEDTYRRISPFLWKEGSYGWGEGERREIGRLRVNNDGMLVSEGEVPERIINIVNKAMDRGLRFDVTQGNGIIPLIIGGEMTVIGENEDNLRPLVEFDQENSGLMLHPVFLEYYRGKNEQQRDTGLSDQQRASLENVLMLSLISGLFKSLGYPRVNPNLIENLATFSGGSDYFVPAIEDVFKNNIAPLSVYNQWVRDYVRYKFRNMMSLSTMATGGRMLNWYKNNHKNKIFAAVFEEILIQHLYNERVDYRDTAGWILAQPEFHGGIFYTDEEPDRSIRKVLEISKNRPEFIDHIVDTFHGVSSKKQKWLLHALQSVIERDEEGLRIQAQTALERIFDVTPLNSYRFGDTNISQNIARTRAGDEAQRVYTKKEPLRFKLRYPKSIELDFKTSLVINGKDSNGPFEGKTISLGDRIDLGSEGYMHEKSLNTSNYDEFLNVSVVIEFDGKRIAVGKRHFDEAIKDVISAEDYKPVTYEKISEITGKNAVIAVAEAQVFYDKLAETMAGGLGALESSFLRAYPYTGVNAHFMLWMYENGSHQSVDENGFPKFEDKYIKEEYLEAIKPFTEETKEIKIYLGVDGNPQEREEHTIKVHKVKLPVEKEDGLFTYAYMLENSELAGRIYPGNDRDFEREKQTVAYAHAVAETMVAFNLDADIVQSHESYSGFVPLIIDEHPSFKGKDVFNKVNHTAFSHSMISTTIPKFPKGRNWLLGFGESTDEIMEDYLKDGETDPFYIAGRKAKKIGVVGNEHRSVMIRSTYPEFADKYVAINDSMYSGYWAADEIVANNYELFVGKEVWDFKQKKTMELIEFIENETRGTKGEITRDDIIVKVKNRNGEEVEFIPPMVVDSIRRWIDYKNNLVANQMPGRNGVSGYEYLAQHAFGIKGGPAHPNNFQTGDVVQYGQAGWMYQLKNEIIPKINKDKKRMALLRYTQQTAKTIWTGMNFDAQMSLPYFEAYGVAFMKAMINYGIVISSYTGGPIENIIDARLDPINGNGYLVSPYSPEDLQDATEDAMARYYAYFSYINDVELSQLIKNNDFLLDLAQKHLNSDPEGLIRIMRNAAAMIAKVDSRRGAEKMVREMWLPAINGEAAASPVSARTAQWKKASLSDPTIDWPVLPDQETSSSPVTNQETELAAMISWGKDIFASLKKSLTTKVLLELVDDITESRMEGARTETHDLDDLYWVIYQLEDDLQIESEKKGGSEEEFEAIRETVSKLQAFREELQRLHKERSSSPVGGIDLNPDLLDLQIRRDDNGVPLPIGRQPIGSMDIDGFLPVIINVTPVTNLPLLLGVVDEEGEDVELSFNVGFDVMDRRARFEFSKLVTS